MDKTIIFKNNKTNVELAKNNRAESLANCKSGHICRHIQGSSLKTLKLKNSFIFRIVYVS